MARTERLVPKLPEKAARKRNTEGFSVHSQSKFAISYGKPETIEWASGIRTKKIQEAEAFLDSKLPKEIQEKANQFYHWYISHTEASWWIDHRYDSPKVTARLNRKTWNK